MRNTSPIAVPHETYVTALQAGRDAALDAAAVEHAVAVAVRDQQIAVRDQRIAELDSELEQLLERTSSLIASRDDARTERDALAERCAELEDQVDGLNELLEQATTP